MLEAEIMQKILQYKTIIYVQNTEKIIFQIVHFSSIVN